MEVLAEEIRLSVPPGSCLWLLHRHQLGPVAGGSLRRLPGARKQGCWSQHTLEDSRTLSIRSRTYLSEIYTPYYLSQLPEVGVPRQDSGLQNRGRATAYSISYGTLFSNLPSSEDAQPASIMTGASILSSQVFSGYDRFILDGEPTPPPGGQPPRLAGHRPRRRAHRPFSGGFAPSRGGFCPGFRSV